MSEETVNVLFMIFSRRSSAIASIATGSTLILLTTTSCGSFDSKFESAYEQCGSAHSFDQVEYDEPSDSITLFRLGIGNREHHDGYSVPAGPDEAVWDCVAEELELPTYIEERVNASRPAFGVQQESYDGVEVSWFSDSDDGYQVTFRPEP